MIKKLPLDYPVFHGYLYDVITDDNEQGTVSSDVKGTVRDLIENMRARCIMVKNVYKHEMKFI